MLETINEEEAKEEGHHNRSSFLKNVGKKTTKITVEDLQKKRLEDRCFPEINF